MKVKAVLCSLCFAITALLSLSQAAANPIFSESAMGMQYPESAHVQLTFMSDSVYGYLGALPIGVLREESDNILMPIGPISISANNGSGITSFEAIQFCDCAVEPGNYTYCFLWEGETPTYVEECTWANVTALPPSWDDYNPPDGDDDDDEDQEIWPWEIPDGPWPKGVNCIDWCRDNPDANDDYMPNGAADGDSIVDPDGDGSTVDGDLTASDGDHPSDGDETHMPADGDKGNDPPDPVDGDAPDGDAEDDDKAGAGGSGGGNCSSVGSSSFGLFCLIAILAAALLRRRCRELL